MIVLLPPSEGKSRPGRGPVLDLASLSFPDLTPTRRRVLDALVELCTGDRDAAAQVLGVGRSLTAEVDHNARLTSAPTAPAARVYTGVLYEALDLGSLSRGPRSRARDQLVVASGLWGLVRPHDPIPAYRLSGGVTLPGIGRAVGAWRDVLRDTVPTLTDGVVVDMRSSAYTPGWTPTAADAGRTVRVRVRTERDGVRRSVSHDNKATKGRLARELLRRRTVPRTVEQVQACWQDAGWQVEAARTARSTPWTMDVVLAG